MKSIRYFFNISILLCSTTILANQPPACLTANITINTPAATVSALPGFLFSAYPANELPDGPNGSPANGFPGWTPYLFSAQVTSPTGDAIQGCHVSWTAIDGYFFSSHQHPKTDNTGSVTGYLRGDNGIVTLTATIDGTSTTDTKLFPVLSGAHNNLAPAVYGSFLITPSTDFMVDVVPTTDPPFTYYEVIGEYGYYTGLQTLNTSSQKAFIFSVWGTNNCAIVPQIVNDPAKICKAPAEGAEGCVLQCFDSNSPWVVNGQYNFHLTATPANSTNNVAGTNYTLVVTDVNNNDNQLYNVTIWSPNVQNISAPSSFIEMFAGNTQSCLQNALEQALWLNPRYKPLGSSTYFKSKYMRSIASLNTAYGQGSMCFNYNFAGLGSLGFMTASAAPIGIGNMTAFNPVTIDGAGEVQTSVVQLNNDLYGINANNYAAIQAAMLANESQYIYGDKDCPNLGNLTNTTLNYCVDSCLSTKGCTSVSYGNGNGPGLCVLRGCTSTTPPMQTLANMASYTMTLASFTNYTLKLNTPSAKQLAKMNLPKDTIHKFFKNKNR